MIRKLINRTSTETPRMKDGPGVVRSCQILNTPEELYGKGRLFSHVTLQKDCGVGWHIHEGDGETYYILRGVGEYSDNGSVSQVTVGDVCVANNGQGHSIVNRCDEPLEFIALILYS